MLFWGWPLDPYAQVRILARQPTDSGLSQKPYGCAKNMSLGVRISGTSDTARPKDLSKILAGFLISREVEGCTELTIRTYRQRLGKFISFINNIPLNNIERSDVDRYLLEIKRRGRSAAYTASCFRAIRAFCNWCVGEGLIDSDSSPVRNMKTPKIPKVGKPFIHQSERDALLKLCPSLTFLGARNAAIVWLFWSTGIRSRELANLKLSDLDWDANKIKVFGKGQKERYVPLTKEAKAAVWRYISFRRDDIASLWLTEERTPATLNMVYKVMRTLWLRTGLPKSVWKDQDHIFRRSWAMRNIKTGIPLKYVQLIGGWESVTVLEGYVRAMTSEDALAARWV